MAALEPSLPNLGEVHLAGNSITSLRPDGSSGGSIGHSSGQEEGLAGGERHVTGFSSLQVSLGCSLQWVCCVVYSASCCLLRWIDEEHSYCMVLCLLCTVVLASVHWHVTGVCGCEGYTHRTDLVLVADPVLVAPAVPCWAAPTAQPTQTLHELPTPPHAPSLLCRTSSPRLAPSRTAPHAYIGVLSLALPCMPVSGAEPGRQRAA